MKNNNQKYIVKAALFIPYALCAEKSEEDIKATPHKDGRKIHLKVIY